MTTAKRRSRHDAAVASAASPLASVSRTSRSALLLALFAATSGATACGEPSGGITARIVFGTSPSSSPAPNTGRSRADLRAAAVPSSVHVLEITALDAEGTTLGATVLSLSPDSSRGELPLEPAGGQWQIDRVPAGAGRSIRGRAYGAPATPPPATETSSTARRGALLYQGAIGGIEVISGRVTNAGVLALNPLVGPEDTLAPGAPAPVVLDRVPAGEALIARFTRPTDADLTGYVIALTSSVALQPEIARGTPIAAGAEIAPGVVAIDHLTSPDPAPVEISGLTDRRTVKVLVYSVDAARNYSTAATIIGFSDDVDPPSATSGLTATASRSQTTLEIGFLAPAEDASTGRGRPARYEVRIAKDAAALAPTVFSLAPAVPATAPSDPGASVAISASFSELTVRASQRFTIGARAVDALGNEGPITLFEYLPGSASPLVTELRPEIALTERDLAIIGRSFGDRTGTVSLALSTSTRTLSLPVSSWTDDRISVRVPLDSRSGLLTIESVEGRTSMPVELGVIHQAAIEAAELPFEIAGAPRAGGDTIAALYTSRDRGSAYESTIERLVGAQPPRNALPPFNAAVTPLAIAGTYSPAADRFLFAVAHAQTIHVLVAPTASTAPGAMRIETAALVDGADSLAIEILEPPPNGSALPALIAFTRSGVIRTATVADVAARSFEPFNVLDSTVTADLLRMRRRSTPADPGASPILMAYREGGPGGVLAVRDGRGLGGGPTSFDPRRAALVRPHVHSRIEVLDVPGVGFVIVYDEESIVDGSVDVRVLRGSDYGMSAGWSPYEDIPPAAEARRLEDAGLYLTPSGDIRIVLVTSRGGLRSRQLSYLEIDPSAIGLSGRGSQRGLDLDFIRSTTARARVGCKPLPAETCPFAWLGPDGPSTLFTRR